MPSAEACSEFRENVKVSVFYINSKLKTKSLKFFLESSKVVKVLIGFSS